jgi:hypothetical protein
MLLAFKDRRRRRRRRKYMSKEGQHCCECVVRLYVCI